MKHTYSILLASMLLFTITACDDSFLQVENEDTIGFEEFLSTEQELQEALNGAYRALADNNFMGGLVQNMTELLGDNINAELVDNADWLKYFNRRTDIFTSSSRDLMTWGGRTVGRANFVLDNMDQISMSEDTRQRIEAEARFIRAIGHFELVRIFAQPYGFTADNSHPGVSIHLTLPQEPTPVPRASVGEVYEQVIADLEHAAENLPATNNNYATSLAAKGYLAIVHFQMNEFDNALAYADDVIRNGGFMLDSLTGRFVGAPGSTESVFAIIGSSGSGTDFNAFDAVRSAYRPGNNTRFLLSNDFLAFAAATDTTRGQKWYSDNTLIKFENGQDRISAPLVHLTELMLIRAESLAQTGGDLAPAIQDLSDIRVRAGLLPVPPATGANELIDIVRKERRYELIGEGDRLQELRRIAVLEEPNLTIRGAIWNCPGMVAQIPDNELAGNSEYPVNPEGGCQ